MKENAPGKVGIARQLTARAASACQKTDWKVGPTTLTVGRTARQTGSKKNRPARMWGEGGGASTAFLFWWLRAWAGFVYLDACYVQDRSRPVAFQRTVRASWSPPPPVSVFRSYRRRP